MLRKSRIEPGSNYGAWAVVVLVIGCLLSGQALADGTTKSKESAASEPRKEGKWEVTPIGRAHSRLHHPYFAAQHRLLLAIDASPAQLWDTQTGKRIAILADQKNGVDSSAVSPDGTRLLTADRLGGWRFTVDEDEKKMPILRSLWLWDLGSGKLLKRFEVDLSAKDLRYSTDWDVEWTDKDKVFIQLECRGNPARASGRTIVGFLDLSTGKVAKWSQQIPGGESLYHSPDGKRALAGRAYGMWRQENGEIAWGGRGTTTSVDLIDMSNSKVIATLGAWKPAEKNWSIVGRYWSSNSQWIALVGSDHSVGIWDGSNGKSVSVIEGHKDWILHVAFSPDGKKLVTASNDETAALWEVSSGKQLRVLTGHTAGLNRALFDSKGERILTAGEDETARLWDVSTGKQLRAWGKHESAVRAVGYEENEKQIWTRTVEGVDRVWSIEDGSLLSEKKSERNGDRYGTLYLKETKDKVYEIWSGPPGVPGEGDHYDGLPRLQPRFAFRGNSGFSAGAITPDGKVAASAGWDRTVSLWDIDRWDKVTGAGRTLLPAQPDNVRRLGIAPDGKSLAIACNDGSLRLWDLTTRKERFKFEGNALELRSLVFSRDGTMLASGSWDRSLYIWKVATGKSIMSKVDVTGRIRAVAFSADGKVLASAGMIRDPNDKNNPSFYELGEIILWDIESGKPKQTLTGIRSGFDCVAFTPDGKTVIAGDFDRNLIFWIVATGAKRDSTKRSSDTPSHLAVSPDSKLLVVTHDFSDVVELWDVANTREIGRFHSPGGGGKPMFSADGKTLIIAGSRVGYWDVAELRKSVRLPEPEEK